MSNTIGKSGFDWKIAPNMATHKFKGNNEYYKKINNKWYWWYYSELSWKPSVLTTDLDVSYYCISKEEDLQMNVKTKVVKGVEDLETGMWVKSSIGKKCIVWRFNKDSTICVTDISCDISQNHYQVPISSFTSWSYTYNGEYTPIVRETEAEKKIKELEATIALAQKQLEEYKDMK